MKRITLAALALIPMFLIGCSAKDEAIITANEWADKYGGIHETYLKNAEMEETTYGGSVPIDYLEKFPYLLTLYEGNGFSKEYLRARGHTYGMEDVIHTARPKPGATCLSCKTIDFINLIEEKGEEAYALKFEDVANMEMETITCYDCHANKPGEIHLSRPHLKTAMEKSEVEFKDQDLVCGQCHVEYYFEPETLVTTLPLGHSTNPKEIFTYYNEIDFADWQHPRAGTNLMKVQHPEFETFQGSVHQMAGANCTTCHMPQVEVNGESVKSHHWTSPLKYTEESCLACHSNTTAPELTARVEDLQKVVFDKTNQCGEAIVTLINALDQAQQNGVDAEKIKQAQALHRESQFYFDFVFVENGEGFHNNKLSNELLDESLKLANEGIALLQ